MGFFSILSDFLFGIMGVILILVGLGFIENSHAFWIGLGFLIPLVISLSLKLFR